MPVSKKQQASVNKYVKSNYDRINVTLPKGEKDAIKAAADKHGESVNGFIKRAISEAMDGTAAPADCGGISLTMATIQTAGECAAATGETVLQFVERAVTGQAARDRISLSLGVNPSESK